MQDDPTGFEEGWVREWAPRVENVFKKTLIFDKKWEFQQKYQPVQKYIYRV